jgi:hypothetical protein
MPKQPRIVLTLRLERPLHHRALKTAQKLGLDLTKLIVAAIEEKLARDGVEEEPRA